jgi:O-antigen/teichoic acid export membrane protein
MVRWPRWFDWPDHLARLRQTARQRAGLRGLGWTGLAQVITLSIRLGSTLVLSRMLSREDYGFFGTAFGVLLLLQWLSDLGVLQSLLRHPDGMRPDFLLTGWWIGLFRGGALSAVTAALALPMAHFHDRPELAGLILALAAMPLLHALRSPGAPRMQHGLRFRAIFVEEIGQAVVATAVTVTAALLLRSVWAIVLGTLAGTLWQVVITYVLEPLRPRWAWDRRIAASLAHTGGQVFLNTLLMALWLQATPELGPKFVTFAEMGLYTFAWGLAAVVEGLVLRACDVHYQLLARNPDPEARRLHHDRVCSVATRYVMPLLALAAVCGPLIFYLLYFRTNFAAAGVVFGLLVARQLMRGLGLVQFQYLFAVGSLPASVWGNAAALVVQAELFVHLGVAFGAKGLALAMTASTTALAAVQTWQLALRGESAWRPFVQALAWVAIVSVLLLTLF